MSVSFDHRLAAAFFALITPGLLAGPAGEPEAPAEAAPRPSYLCHKVTEPIEVDGLLNETCWREKPVLPFRGIADGSEPALATMPKMVWDDRYLYVGVEVLDPDVWARCGLRDGELPQAFAEQVSAHRRSKNPEWHRLECDIMTYDKFIKVFLDPDGDGKKYVEFHVNPINNVFDAWYEFGFHEKWGDWDRSPHVNWSMEGLLTATQVQGTLNAPHDVDRGWSLEMAIPWLSLSPFVKGACPPEPGDAWTAHLGRVHKPKFRTRNIYWTWPVIGQTNCHLPDRYGRLFFADP